MSGWQGTGPFERLPVLVAGDVRRVRFRGANGAAELSLERPDATAAGALPARVDTLAVQPAEDGRVLLVARAGGHDWRVPAAGWRVHERRAGFFDAALAPYAPTAGERRTVGLLLRLLRIPGATRLIRAWHARRAR